MGISTLSSNTRFLGTTRVHHPTGICTDSATLAGLMNVNNKQTLYSMCSNKPHPATAAMRPNNNSNGGPKKGNNNNNNNNKPSQKIL